MYWWCKFFLRPTQGEYSTFSEGSYSVMVITLDFESSDPGSNPGRTSIFVLHRGATGETSTDKKEWRIRVSIPVPHACKARTLPIELIPQFALSLVGHGTDFFQKNLTPRLSTPRHPSMNADGLLAVTSGLWHLPYSSSLLKSR